MNKRVLRWWLLGAAAYLVFLGANFPAQYLADHISKQLPELQLNGVSGTIFSGSATEVRYQGTAFGAVDWHFDWLAPFTMSLGYRIDLRAEDRDVHGRVDFGFNRISLRSFEGRLPLSVLGSWLPVPPNSLDGFLSPHLKQLTLKAGRLVSAEGELDLDEVSMKWPASAMLGSFKVQLTPAADGTQAEVADVGSPLKLQASLSFSSEGAYHLAGTLAARDPGDQATRSLLSDLGRPDSTGQYPFDFKGQW
jgi:general secretion pathway protein N